MGISDRLAFDGWGLYPLNEVTELAPPGGSPILSNPTHMDQFYHNKWSDSPGHPPCGLEEWILVVCPAIIEHTTLEAVQTRLEKVPS